MRARVLAQNFNGCQNKQAKRKIVCDNATTEFIVFSSFFFAFFFCSQKISHKEKKRIFFKNSWRPVGLQRVMEIVFNQQKFNLGQDLIGVNITSCAG